MEIDIKKIEVAAGIDPKVVEVYRLLKQYQEAPGRSDFIERRKECWKAATENEQWDDDEKKELKKKKMVPLVINKLNKGVQGSAAIVTNQKPEVKFFPIGSGDLYVAELLKRAHDMVWAKNSASDITYAVVEERQIGGIGFFNPYHDPSKGLFGRLIIEDSPPDDIYWDKDSRRADMSDTPLIKAKLRSKKYILDNYEGLKDEDLVFNVADGTGDSDKSSGVTGGDNYVIDASKPAGGQDLATEDLKNIWEIEAWLLKTQRENWVVFVGDDGMPTARKLELPAGESSEGFDPQKEAERIGGKLWKRRIEKRVFRVVVGSKLVEERVNPYGEDADGNPVCGLIPLRAQKTLDGFPRSPTFFARDINKEKNKRRAQFIHAASHLVNAPVVRSDDAKWKGDPGTPGSELIVSKNAPFQPYRLNPGSMEIGHFIELETMADRDIDDQYDLHDVMRGKLPSAGMAGRTVLALQDMGGMMSKPFLSALESSLVRLAKVDAAIILKKWPRQMWERLLEPEELETWTPNGPAEFEDGQDQENQRIREKIRQKWSDALEKIRPMDPSKPPGISLIDLDVRIAAGSSMPTNRMARGQMAIEYVKAGIYDTEAALNYIDDPEKDKISVRMKQREQAALQAAAMKGVKA